MPSPRTLLLIVLALVVAGTTALMARGWIQSERQALAGLTRPVIVEADLTEILVAARDIPAGTFVTESHLRWQAWPADNLSDTYVVQSDDAGEIFVGAVVRSGIAEGEPITTGRVVRPGDRGFLAAVLQPGHRAISVAVNATSGISGFVFPGDRVDLILTHAVQYEDRPPRHAAETIMSDVRVLAIDQSTDDQEGEPTLAKTATLEVTPRQAEVIGVASELGHLSLSLRSMATAETPDILRTFTWDSQASRLIPFDATGRVVRVVVSRGNKEEIVELGAP